MFHFRQTRSEEMEKWNQFVAQNDSIFGGMLQSWEWGEFQKGSNHLVWRFIAEENDIWHMVAQIIRLDLPLGKFLFYVPHGPIVAQNSFFQKECTIQLESFLIFLKKFTKENNALFLRIDFPFLESFPKIRFFRSQNGIKAARDIEPSETVFTDLHQQNDEIFLGFKPKTRYNIRVAQKHGVEIKKIDPKNNEAFIIFYSLLKETARRQGFFLHPEKYYRMMFSLLPSHFFSFFMALLGKQYIGGALIINFGGVATYLHGGFQYEKRSVMAPYLLHWEIMQWAKAHGALFYNWNGVRLEEKKITWLQKLYRRESTSRSSWEGITRFKFSFSKKEDVIKTLGTFEFPARKFLYKAYHFRDILLHG